MGSDIRTGPALETRCRYGDLAVGQVIADLFAVFCPEVDAVYYVRRDEIPAGMRRQMVLRLSPAKNGQVKKTRAAVQFEGAKRIFGPVAQWTEQRPSKS